MKFQKVSDKCARGGGTVLPTTSCTEMENSKNDKFFFTLQTAGGPKNSVCSKNRGRKRLIFGLKSGACFAFS